MTAIDARTDFETFQVVVAVRDPDGYERRVPWLGRLAGRANRRIVGSPMTVAPAGLRITSEGLLELLRKGLVESRRS